LTALLIAVGAAVGAVLRYLVDRAVQARHGSVFPWGTFTVNVGGSMLLGLLAGGAVTGAVTALVGVGFCGALTTYSTFGYETMRLAERGSRRYALLNVVANVAAGLAGAALGYAVGRAL